MCVSFPVTVLLLVRAARRELQKLANKSEGSHKLQGARWPVVSASREVRSETRSWKKQLLLITRKALDSDFEGLKRVAVS